jgi:hypothetical protein
MNYYGTDLNTAGHYFWELGGNDIRRSRANYQDFPFNPEGLPYIKIGHLVENGIAKFYQFAGFSIYAIEGSCADKRAGSKSIFFVEQGLDKEQMKALILATPIASRIIEKMPFEVQW